MTRTMHDAITAGQIPVGATLVAGYADGAYANLPAMRTRFPHATVVSIAVKHTTRAMVADVETGDMSPDTAVLWARDTMHDVDNALLTLYANTSTWPAVKAAFAKAGVSLPQWWAAHYTGVAHLEPGSVATQYADPGPYDLSLVADYWPGVDPKPKPPVKYVPFPGAKWFTVGRKSPTVAAMHRRLVAVGCNRYKTSTNEDVIGSGDEASYEAWQAAYNKAHHKGWTGAALKWPPGKETWDALQVPSA